MDPQQGGWPGGLRWRGPPQRVARRGAGLAAVTTKMFEADEIYMRKALALAREAGEAGDVPVGAVVTSGDRVLAGGQNRRQRDGDPTAHAEVEALRQASRIVGNWRVEGVLYVTQEPCPMCSGAIVNARVSRLVYGCPNPKAGAVDTLFSIATDPRLNHRVEIVRGVLADEAASLLRDFFAALRAGDAK